MKKSDRADYVDPNPLRHCPVCGRWFRNSHKVYAHMEEEHDAG